MTLEERCLVADIAQASAISGCVTAFTDALNLSMHVLGDERVTSILEPLQHAANAACGKLENLHDEFIKQVMEGDE